MKRTLFAFFWLLTASAACLAQSGYGGDGKTSGDSSVASYIRLYETAPGAATTALAGAGAGNVDNGAHLVKVTCYTPGGQTTGGTVSNSTTVADKTVNGKIAISSIPTCSPMATGRKVYMTTAGGSTYYLLSNGTIADNSTTTLTANDADATLTASTTLPTSNTALDARFTIGQSTAIFYVPSVPNAVNTTDIGSTTKWWKDLYFGTSASFYAKQTITPTANRTITFPDASITVAGSASALTSGRVPFATTGGLLTDSANLAFDSNGFLVGGSTNADTLRALIKTATTNSTTVTALRLWNAGSGSGAGAGIEMGYGDGTATTVRIGGYYDGVGAGMRFSTGTGSAYTDRMFLSSNGVLALGPASAAAIIGSLPTHAQGISFVQGEESLTIAAAATTDTTMQIPAGAVVLSVNVRVTTVIPTAATFTVTGATSGTTFNTAAVSTAANTTDAGTAAGTYYNATAQKIRITPNLVPGAATGVVRITVVYYVITPPTS